jgi:hypothetical protein
MEDNSIHKIENLLKCLDESTEHSEVEFNLKKLIELEINSFEANVIVFLLLDNENSAE